MRLKANWDRRPDKLHRSFFFQDIFLSNLPLLQHFYRCGRQDAAFTTWRSAHWAWEEPNISHSFQGAMRPWTRLAFNSGCSSRHLTSSGCKGTNRSDIEGLGSRRLGLRQCFCLFCLFPHVFAPPLFNLEAVRYAQSVSRGSTKPTVFNQSQPVFPLFQLIYCFF